MDSRKEKNLHPESDKLWFCVYLCPNIWENGGDEILLFKSLQTQLGNMNLQFFYRLHKCHYITNQVKSMQFYFVQHNMQGGYTDN